jgi:diadenosine tetraphosphatase ApaH/serine/threonine PP2A family protein phosphatase
MPADMRIAVVADVHSNLEAFEAVLAHARSVGEVDGVWSLGDLVGYGPDPNACIALLRSQPHEAIAGNHDLACIGAIDVDDFNPFAAQAARWTQAQLGAEGQSWLAGLPLVKVMETGFTLAHGSLNDPVWEYVLSGAAARNHLAAQTTAYGLIGHTHLPSLFYDGPETGRPPTVTDGSTVALDERRFVANPGSVGQPRDGDRRAAYALLDMAAKNVTFHRVAYDLATTQAKMRDAGLPAFLWQRLERGR